MDLNKKSFSIEIGGRTLSVETSLIAEQANAAVICRYGDTAVLSTVVMGREDKNIDYMPLTVEYEQKFYAVGKILGSRFVRREGKAPDDAVLNGRLLDRTLRPLFDHRLRREIQVVNTILSYDGENDHPFVALIAASTALSISDIPWNGPVAGVNISKIGAGMMVNPKMSEIIEPAFDAFASGTADRINMIELEGREASEADVAEGFGLAQKEITKIVNFINEIVKKIGKAKANVKLAEPDADLVSKVNAFLTGKLDPAIYVKDKVERENNLSQLKKDLLVNLTEGGADEKALVAAEQLLERAIDGRVHEQILKSDKRPDGRKLDEVRDLYAETHLFERLHGSALFIRGNTQSLSSVTLGSPEAEQLIETMDFSGKKRFMLHYNFPPYSVGEAKPFRGPGRREIGHGALAEKALRNMIPSKETFPYTIRVVSEILSSNGSSSMATVCAGSLALMDAGVPVKKAVAGIAMGIMTDDKGNYKVLTDLQGPEDHYGDMDFKVAGTADGVTAIQLDVKFQGLTGEMIMQTLKDAKAARLHILGVMNKTLASPRTELSKYAPMIFTMPIDPKRIGLLVGPGGKTINGIIERTGVTSIDIDQEGSIFIVSMSKETGEAARREIESLLHEFNLGDIVEGEIIKILDFGAIMDLGGGKDGMIHVSELKEGYVKRVEDVVKVGDHVWAKVIRSEEGRIGLSMKGIPQERSPKSDA